MSKVLQKALETLRALPSAEAETIAYAILALAGHDEEPEGIDPADLPVVMASMAKIKHGDRATPQQIEAAFKRFER